jgi:sn-glycerol 3-phosphate transport system permease protein
LLRLVQNLWDGLRLAPDGLRYVLDYYAALPGGQLLPSLAVGAAVGAALSLYFARRLHLAARLPIALALGALSGAAGAQILVYITRHCTYTPEASAIESALGVAITAFSALLGALPLWTLWLSRRAAPQASDAAFKGALLPLLFLAPTLLNLLLFLYYPSLQTFALSLNSRRFPLPQERFVCLGNYINVTQEPIYQNSFFVTAFITVAIVIGSLAASLAIALLASQKIRGANIYRALLIWPFALSPVVTGTVFLAMFRETGGLINYFVTSGLGLPAASWLRDPNLARWVVVLASVWNILGFNVLFYIAGLQSVPRDLLEASAIDGAGLFRRFWRVTFPLLAPYTFFLLVTNVTYSFYGIYGAVDTLTQGGPQIGPAGSLGGATSVLIFKLYQDAFNPGSPLGLAAAQAIILFGLVAALTLLQFRYIERQITYGDKG